MFRTLPALRWKIGFSRKEEKGWELEEEVLNFVEWLFCRSFGHFARDGHEHGRVSEWVMNVHTLVVFTPKWRGSLICRGNWIRQFVRYHFFQCIIYFEFIKGYARWFNCLSYSKRWIQKYWNTVELFALGYVHSLYLRLAHSFSVVLPKLAAKGDLTWHIW